MHILARSCVIAMISFSGPAFGQSGPDSINAKFRSWSGFWGGVQVGGSHTQFGNGLSNGEQFCVASTAGNGVSAGCDIGSDYASTEAFASLPGARGIANALSTIVGGDSAIAANVNVDTEIPGPIGGTPAFGDFLLLSNPNGDGTSLSVAVSTKVDGSRVHQATSRSFAGSAASSDRFFTVSKAEATDSTGSSSATAIALANILDFGSGDFSDRKSPAFGGHFHYDHQFMNNFILGVGADFLILPTNEAEKSFSDATDFSLIFDGASDRDVSASGTQRVDMDTYALASARVRLGHAAGNMMSYVTGGLAVGDFQANLQKSVSLSVDGVSPYTNKSSQRDSITALGGVLGGGLSMWLGERTALSFEALYYIFNEEINFSSSEVVELENITTATVKISYKLK